MKLFVEKLEYQSAVYRLPYRFGSSVVSAMTMPVVTVRLAEGGREAVGHGAMSLGNAWAFPAAPHEDSLAAMRRLTDQTARTIHGLEAGPSILDLSRELEHVVGRLTAELSGETAARDSKTQHPPLAPPGEGNRKIPKLAALVVFSAFDIAAFDAWGRRQQANTFARLREGPEGTDLARWLDDDFRGFGLAQVVAPAPQATLAVFHSVGGLDPLTAAEVAQPVGDGLPEHLGEWIVRDGLTHLKLKLRGDDPAWDFQRIKEVDRLAAVTMRCDPTYSLDFNERCASGAALVELLRRVKREAPAAFGRIAYVEQPTARELVDRPEDRMHEAATLKPVVIDESLTDYGAFQRARALGYSGVAVKACKGIGPSLLMAAACRRHRLFLCAQDLTCPGLALLASASLAAWLGCDGLEVNARQFCPSANAEWARRLPEVFTVRQGRMETGGLVAEGLGYGA